MVTRAEWTGTATELLNVLAGTSSELDRKSKAWPDSPRALAGRLRRAATFLREAGIQVSFDREGHARTRVIRIAKEPESVGTLPAAPSASSAALLQPNLPKGIAALRARTVANDADDAAEVGPQADRPHQPLAIKR
jgi:hypothetical protein